MGDKLTYDNIEHNMYFFNHGTNFAAEKFLGAKPATLNGEEGYRFTVWAPHAKSVGLAGEFNDWQPEPMEAVGETGAWTLFSKDAKQWDMYKFTIEDQSGNIHWKQDPFAFAFEIPPLTASVIQDFPYDYEWDDQDWIKQRKDKGNYEHDALSIYEVHQSSWRTHADGSAYSFDELADELIPYVKKMGYTHIEFMPLTDHPLDASWGYQTSGYFSIAGRYNHDFEPLMRFINRAHHEGIGVLVDWVPSHFVVNADSLALYDGTPTYEYVDPDRARNIRWGTINFDLGKPQVRSFLISNALFWLEYFHFDGMRIDAVSNMLYLDYDDGPWKPNRYGTNKNLEGIDFLQCLNEEVKGRDPSLLMIAEESSVFEGVTKPVKEGGLGFDYKWNMGWMNDTLEFFSLDPIYRSYNYRRITFTFMYMFSEHYVLPFSHDEVVHGKHSILGRMPGESRYNQFANLRVLSGYKMTYPGKKLTFMGNEIGVYLEWRFYEGLEWDSLEREYNSEYHHYIQTINHLYQEKSAFYYQDLSQDGITFLEADDPDQTIIGYIRNGEHKTDKAICLFNFTPVERDHYRIGVPYPGTYRVLLNSEMNEFGGKWDHQVEEFHTEDIPHQRQPYSVVVTLPGESTFILEPKDVDTTATPKAKAETKTTESTSANDARNTKKRKHKKQHHRKKK
ncbi:MAG: 1,4-alpha-glucan branching protein GlgB [Aerococcus sp.]|nr:1,4-alpha-glucan branching protein GlgB [Aerococcus sp.]